MKRVRTYKLFTLMMLINTSLSLYAMKRPAEEIEELKEQKPAKVPAREAEEFAFYPEWLDEALNEIEEKRELVQEQHAESAGKAFEALPKDLKVYIMRFLLPAKGDTKEFQLQVAANNIRSFMQISKAFKPLLDDLRVNGEVIEMLAKRYISTELKPSDLLHVALALQTTGAGKWLQENMVGKAAEAVIFDTLCRLAQRNDREKCLFILKFFPGFINTRKEYLFAEGESDKITPLMLAIVTNNLGLIDTLLAIPGIKINKKSSGGVTALQYIFFGDRGPKKQNQLPMVQRLLAQPEIDVNILEAGDMTALSEAAFSATDEAFALLVADPRIDVNRGEPSPLEICVQNGFVNKVKMLLAHPSIDTKGMLELAESQLAKAQKREKWLANTVSSTLVAEYSISNKEQIKNFQEIIRLLKMHGAQKQTEPKIRGFKPY